MRHHPLDDILAEDLEHRSDSKLWLPEGRVRHYIMYVFGGGGYGGSGNGLTNGCSTIGIGKTHATHELRRRGRR